MIRDNLKLSYEIKQASMEHGYLLTETSSKIDVANLKLGDSIHMITSLRYHLDSIKHMLYRLAMMLCYLLLLLCLALICKYSRNKWSTFKSVIYCTKSTLFQRRPIKHIPLAAIHIKPLLAEKELVVDKGIQSSDLMQNSTELALIGVFSEEEEEVIFLNTVNLCASFTVCRNIFLHDLYPYHLNFTHIAGD
jgi:hypothetical protein